MNLRPPRGGLKLPQSTGVGGEVAPILLDPRYLEKVFALDGLLSLRYCVYSTAEHLNPVAYCLREPTESFQGVAIDAFLCVSTLAPCRCPHTRIIMPLQRGLNRTCW